MSEPYRVMAVCHGNICRSPIAEVVLRDRFERAGLGDRVVVDSRGISAEERGNPIDDRAQIVLRRRGYAVPDRRARKVRADELDDRDLILAMTRRHERVLVDLAATDDTAGRVRLYRGFDPEMAASIDPSTLDMADPWYGDLDDFEVTIDQVEAAADAIVEFVADDLDDGDPTTARVTDTAEDKTL